MRRLLFIALSVSLSACSLGGGNSKTIGSLRNKPMELPTADTRVEFQREKAIESYQEFLELQPGLPHAPEAMRRLADLKLESGQAAEAEADEEAVRDTAQTQDVVRLYESLLKTYPTHEKNDRVLYQLAQAYEDLGQREKALGTLDLIVRRYPNTDLIDEVQFRRAEMLFVARNYAASGQAYKRVVEYGDTSPFFEQSLYKRGWALFKQSRYDEGVDSLLELLDRNVVDNTIVVEDLSRGERERLNDTLRAISLSFWYQGGGEAMREYFGKNNGRVYEDLIYANLGDLYLEKERYNDAADTYRMFAESNPLHKKAPVFHAKVIEAYKKGNFPSKVLAAKKDFVRRYDLREAYWQAHPPEEAPEVLVLLKSNVTDLAKHYHASAQRTKAKADYQEAANWYRVYLGSFPDDADAPGVHFLLGEVLFEDKQFGEATRAYEATAYDYPEHAKAAEAGYAALLAYAEHEKLLQGEDKNIWHAQGTESALRFAATFPEHKEAPAVLVHASEELYAANDLERASTNAKIALERYPGLDPTLRRTALTVVAHSAFDGEDYLAAESAYQEVLQITAADDPNRGAMAERLAASVYKQGEAAKAQGDLRGAVTHFLRVGYVAPGTSIVATAEYDAAAALLTLQDWSQAAVVLEGFRKSYPNHELQTEVTQKLAVAYLQSGQVAKAATELETIAASTTDPVKRQEVSWQAAELYEEAGLQNRAIDAYVGYIKQFPQPVEQSVEARHRLVGLHEKKGDAAGARFWLQDIIKADRAAGTQSTERTRFLAAKASITLADDERIAFEQVRLVEPIKENMSRKKATMERALSAYGEAADYGVAEVATAATHNIAGIYYNFSKEILDSERPKSLTGEELEEYEILLEEQAYPFEEKAIEVYEENVKRIPTGVYDDWISRSIEQLAQLLPARYKREERSERVVESIQ